MVRKVTALAVLLALLVGGVSCASTPEGKDAQFMVTYANVLDALSDARDAGSLAGDDLAEAYRVTKRVDALVNVWLAARSAPEADKARAAARAAVLELVKWSVEKGYYK